MDSTTHPAGTQAPDSATLAAEAKKRRRQVLLVGAFTLWVIGLIALLASAVIVHFSHPGPWPFDLQTTVTLQSPHYSPWLQSIIDFPSRFNDIAPSVIALALWLAGLLLVAWLIKRRGKSPMLWVVAAIFLVGGTAFADLVLNFLIVNLVRRPRPSPLLIHVYNPEPVPSFPSGHVEHTVVYYGFLLYLSFTKPVREWRYHWLLLPLQIFAALNILLIGYSRIEEGAHWLTDVLAGYLEGAVALVLLIFLYRWTLKKLEERRAKRLVEQPA
jgi:membrane-associated phospholipid phosphatase